MQLFYGHDIQPLFTVLLYSAEYFFTRQRSLHTHMPTLSVLSSIQPVSKKHPVYSLNCTVFRWGSSFVFFKQIPLKTM